MSILNSKFRVLRGWKPGDVIPAVDNAMAHLSGGVPDVLPAGTIVTRHADGSFYVPPSVVTAANAATQKPDIRIVFSGSDDFDSIAWGGKIIVARGNFRVQAANVQASQSFPLGGPVSYNTSGQFKDAGSDMIIGRIVENRLATEGVIIIDLALN